MIRTSKRLWIVEGPDGAGKTTLARALAERHDAHYVHLGPFPRVDRGLARLYVDAMLPAVLGYADVVMDRCWLSERPYGVVYRDGADRLGSAARILERLAWRCQTVVVRCLPPLDRVLENFGRRPEMLDTTVELRAVYGLYQDLVTSLPMMTVDPFTTMPHHLIDRITRHPASIPHMLEVPSAGNLRSSKVILVGETFAQIGDRDPLYQWPFGGLCRDGCSRWLADQLDGVSERDLFWVNADALTPAIRKHSLPIVALGGTAARRLTELGRPPDHAVAHPQYHRRFEAGEPYPLLEVLRRLIDG